MYSTFTFTFTSGLVWSGPHILESPAFQKFGICLLCTLFLGPRGPLGTPSLVSLPVGAKNMDQLYSSINHHKTTANLSLSGACLVVFGGVLCMSGGVNVYLY